MSLARWDPFTELRRIREDVDRMFDAYPSVAPLAAPVVDVFEKDEKIVVKAEVPGLKKDDLEVIATEDSVSLKGEFKKEEEVKEEGFYRRERRVGRFYRTISMPSAIKPDQVTAKFKDGILEVTAPRAEAEKAREKKVQIET